MKKGMRGDKVFQYRKIASSYSINKLILWNCFDLLCELVSNTSRNVYRCLIQTHFVDTEIPPHTFYYCLLNFPEIVQIKIFIS